MHNSIHIHAGRSNVNDYPKDYGSSNISSNSELLGPVFTTRFPGCATHQSQSNGLNATIDQWDRHSDYLHLLHIRSISSMCTQIGANLLATWEKGGLHCIESLKIDTTAEDKLMMQVFTIFFRLASLSLLPLPFWWRSRCLTPTTNQWQSTWSKSRTDA